MDATVNIHNPLTALLCFGTTPTIDSSNYTINSIWLSEQQAAQMCNFGHKHQRYLAAMQYKIREDYLDCSTFFYNNHYTKYVDQVEIWIIDVYN